MRSVTEEQLTHGIPKRFVLEAAAEYFQREGTEEFCELCPGVWYIPQSGPSYSCAGEPEEWLCTKTQYSNFDPCDEFCVRHKEIYDIAEIMDKAEKEYKECMSDCDDCEKRCNICEMRI